MSKDLLYKHFDLFNDVMNASEITPNFVSCPSCDFKMAYKSHTLSFESSMNKVISHILDCHK